MYQATSDKRQEKIEEEQLKARTTVQIVGLCIRSSPQLMEG
jgi:hypothetical protein